MSEILQFAQLQITEWRIMHGSFIFGIILKSYHETEQNFKNVQRDMVCGGRDTSRVAIQRKTVSLLWQIEGLDVQLFAQFNNCALNGCALITDQV